MYVYLISIIKTMFIQKKYFKKTTYNTVCCGVRVERWPHTPNVVGSNPTAAVDCLP